MPFHIATSAKIADDVRIVHRKRACFVDDNLLVGPCALDPEAHCEKRIDFWGFHGRERTHYLESFQKVLAALRSCEQVTLWASRLWSDTLMLWALCAWRLHVGPKEPAIELFLLRREAETGVVCGSIGIAPPIAQEKLPHAARPLLAARAREMAEHWRRVTGQAPVLSAEDDAAIASTDLAKLGTYQAAFFPRWDRGTLVLSRFDELLFSCLSRKWTTPLDVFRHRSTAGEELRQCLPLTGDVFLAMRLRAWSIGADAALESEPLLPKNRMKEARYRLTDTGETIRRDGLADLERGSRLPVWGSTAYDPQAPWVVQNDKTGGAHLRQLGAEPFLLTKASQ